MTKSEFTGGPSEFPFSKASQRDQPSRPPALAKSATECRKSSRSSNNPVLKWPRTCCNGHVIIDKKDSLRYLFAISKKCSLRHALRFMKIAVLGTTLLVVPLRAATIETMASLSDPLPLIDPTHHAFPKSGFQTARFTARFLAASTVVQTMGLSSNCDPTVLSLRFINFKVLPRKRQIRRF